jgi:hypothetical protein
LKRVAKRLEQLGAEYDKIGSELVYQCNRVPSYGGQLSGPAHKAGAVARYDANTLRDLLRDHSKRLMEISKQFENVDGETVGKINYWDLFIHGLMNLIAEPEITPFVDIDLEKIFGKYHQAQGDSARCADFSLSMVCNIFFDSRGESTERCTVDKITKFLEAILFGKFPWEGGGTTPWGIGAGLDGLDIPNTFRADGSLDVLEDALKQIKYWLSPWDKSWIRRMELGDM